MTWDAVHTRGAVLRDVVDAADRRNDGVLPRDVPGVSETFADDFDLVTALQLRWHTRLAGRIERALAEETGSLESAVLSAWCATAEQLPGVRRVLDDAADAPTSERLDRALTTARNKERLLLATMAGLARGAGPAAVRVGGELEDRARALRRPVEATRPLSVAARPAGLIGRLRARLVA